MVGRLCACLVLLDALATVAGRCKDMFESMNSNERPQWKDVPASHKKAMETCGYDESVWTGAVACFECWDDLSKEQQEATIVLGGDKACQDKAMQILGKKCKSDLRPQPKAGCIGSLGVYGDKVAQLEKPWHKLSKKQKEAASTCGSSEAIWDGPKECRKCFKDLSSDKQEAVKVIAGSEDCFDDYIDATYGLGCKYSQLMPLNYN